MTIVIGSTGGGGGGAGVDPSQDLGPFDASKGLLLTSPDGLSIRRARIDNDGSLLSEPVVADDFSIAASPTTVSVQQGSASTSAISTAVIGGSAQSVALTASGLPTGATAAFSPTSVTAGGSGSTLTLTSGGSTPAGSYTVTVIGTGTSATHTTTVTFVVTTGIVDTFNRVDSGTLGISSSGHTWAQLVGGLGIVSNKAGPGTGFAAFSANIAVIESGLANASVAAMPASTSSSIRLLFRVINASNYWDVRGGQLCKTVAGVETSMGLYFGSGTPERMRATFSGDQIDVYFNNHSTPDITVHDSFAQSATKHGILLADSAASIDDFSIS